MLLLSRAGRTKLNRVSQFFILFILLGLVSNNTGVFSKIVVSLDDVEEVEAPGAAPHPAAGDMLGDFDHDGIVEPLEVIKMRQKLRTLFDSDASGQLEKSEILGVAENEEDDVRCVYSALDANEDHEITDAELDGRWEELGAELTVSEVVDWLSYAIMLPQYSNMFLNNAVSGYSFPLLIESQGERLKELGITSDLHRKQIMMGMRRRIAGIGHYPSPITEFKCTESEEGSSKKKSKVVKLSWKPESDLDPQRYQVQRRGKSSNWRTIYVGNELTYLDVVTSDAVIASSTSTSASASSTIYRVCSWNSYARSSHVYQECTVENSNSWSASFGTWYADGAATLAMVALWMLCHRLHLAGKLDFAFRLLRTLPPNRPTHIVTSEVKGECAIRVSWDVPISNGTSIVSYVVHCKQLRDSRISKVTLNQQPLPKFAYVRGLVRGETYQVCVEVFNSFGKSAMSSNTIVYISPTKVTSVQKEAPKSFQLSHSQRNKCYICLEPGEKAKIPVRKFLDRRILHFCRVCDLQFCHVHRGYVNHSRALTCPAFDGKCICSRCFENEKNK